MNGMKFFCSIALSVLALAISSVSTASAQCVTCNSQVQLGTGMAGVIILENGAYAGANSPFSIQIGLAPDGSSLAQDGTYDGWCIDQPSTLIDGTGPLVTPYLTTNNASLPADMQNAAAWPKVNWVVNNRTGYTAEDVQRVIWMLLGRDQAQIDAKFAPTTTSATLLSLANTNGGAFVPQPGQKVVVLLREDGLGGTYQDMAVEVPLPPCGTVGSLVWKDTNGNGIQDSGEPGINNVVVTLSGYDANLGKTVTLTTTTATVSGVAGTYSFSSLCSNTYTVSTSGPGGSYNPSPSLAGSDRGLDSNGSPTQVTIDLATKPEDLTVDFGFVPVVLDGCTGAIGNFVWYDANGNGIQDSGEFGLPGVTVRLAGAKTDSVQTTASGAYKFENLCSGNYTVTVVNPSTAQSGRPGLQATITGGTSDDTKDSNPNPNTFFLGLNLQDMTRDFGYKGYGGCTLTQGYWKNHASVWPVDSLFLGGRAYSKTELLSLLNAPVKGDVSIALAYQLIAAKLNLYGGSAVPATVNGWIAQADALLSTLPKLPANVASNSAISSVASNLDGYNNGKAGPAHCN